MDNDGDDAGRLTARMDRLEARVDRLQEDAVHTRALATMADRDSSEVRLVLKGQTNLLNALRETQVEQGRTLTEHGALLAGLVVDVAALHGGQEALRGEVTTLKGDVAELKGDVAELKQGQGRHEGMLREILDRLPPRAG